MSSREVNSEQNVKKDPKWMELIASCESAIEAYSEKIKRLRKSIVFFTEQANTGVPYPTPNSSRHKELS
jgi:hypothetical protein